MIYKVIYLIGLDTEKKDLVNSRTPYINIIETINKKRRYEPYPIPNHKDNCFKRIIIKNKIKKKKKKRSVERVLTTTGSSISSIPILLTNMSPYSPMHQTVTRTRLSCLTYQHRHKGLPTCILGVGGTIWCLLIKRE